MNTTAMTPKKHYEKPTMKVYALRRQRLICSSDPEWRGIPGGPFQF